MAGNWYYHTKGIKVVRPVMTLNDINILIDKMKQSGLNNNNEKLLYSKLIANKTKLEVQNEIYPRQKG